MRRILGVKQMTQTKFLNLYELDMENDTGRRSTYYVSSRAKKVEDLKLKTHKNKADGVIIYSLYGSRRSGRVDSAVSLPAGRLCV